MTLDSIQNKKVKRRNILKACTFIFLFIVFFTWLNLGEIHALSESQQIEWYKNNSEIIMNNGFFESALRGLCWYITKGLVYIASETEKIFDLAFGFIDFTKYTPVVRLINRFKPILVGIMALSLLWLGITLIMHHEKKPKLFINIAVFILVMTCTTTLFAALNSALISFKDDMSGKKTSTVYSIVDNNMLDLIRVDKSGEGGKSDIIKLNFNKNAGRGFYGGVISGKDKSAKQKAFSCIDYNEVLNYKNTEYGYHDDLKTLLEGKLVTLGKKDYIRKVRNGYGWNSGDDADLGNEFYYRYHFNFLVGWIQIASLILVYLALSYKTIRVIFELVVARLLAYVYSAEVSGGEKIKRIGVFIRDSYILLCVNIVCVKIFSLFSKYLANNSSISTLVGAIFSLFIAFAVIDGPNLVEKLLGMDAGLKSSTGRILAAGATLKAASGSVLRTPKKAVNAAAGAKGAFHSAKDKFSAAAGSSREETNSNSSGSNAKGSSGSGSNDKDKNKNKNNGSGSPSAKINNSEHDNGADSSGHNNNNTGESTATAFNEKSAESSSRANNESMSKFNEKAKQDNSSSRKFSNAFENGKDTSGKSKTSMPKVNRTSSSNYINNASKKGDKK